MMKRVMFVLVILFSFGLVSAANDPDIFGHQMGEIKWVATTCSDGDVITGISNLGTAACGSFSGNSLAASDGTPSQAVFVDADGDVGIGTKSPDEKLDVEADGASWIRVRSNNAAADIIIGSDGTTSQVSMIQSGSGDALAFNVNGGVVKAMRILSNGNVGIGTTSPYSLLEISGTSPVLDVNAPSGNPSIILSESGTTRGTLIFGVSGNDLILRNEQESTGADLNFGTRGVTRMTIDDMGNVGIGTANPGRELDVAGIIGWDGAYSSEVGHLKSVDTDNAAIIATKELAFYVAGGGVRAMHIDNIGNVGIGTTNPGAKLDVAGNIVASGSICANGGNDCIGGGSSLPSCAVGQFLMMTASGWDCGSASSASHNHCGAGSWPLCVD